MRPVLVDNCFSCHSTSASGGLEMKSRDALLKGGNSGPAIVPGHPERSLLIQAVSHTHERLKMPFQQTKLPERQIADLEWWVRRGAVWPRDVSATTADGTGRKYRIRPEQRGFWAFRPLHTGHAPQVENDTWTRSSIDRFILSRLEGRGLRPAKKASKLALLRRAYFDLIGLPPTPDDVRSFLDDRTPTAFERVVDKLLASPRYGERWGRLWLDLARYSDDKLNSTQDEPYANAFRYRDWVIQAFNDDMPYDLFIKAQLAGDLLQGVDNERLVGGLGFYALSPQFQDDRVDATTRSFMALTAGCAQCHDHKFDPIPTEDFYALLGVFNSTRISEYPLAPQAAVDRYQQQEEKLNTEKEALAEFREGHSQKLVDVLASQISRYIMAAWQTLGPAGQEVEAAAETSSLDRATLERWVKYFQSGRRDHPFLDGWDALLENEPGASVGKLADEFQALAISVIREQRKVDAENEALRRGKTRPEIGKTEMLSMERDRYFLWRDLAFAEKFSSPAEFESGILYYRGENIDRFLGGVWKEHLRSRQERIKILEKGMPEKYPFLHILSDIEDPRNEHVHIRGNKNNLGDEVPRRFLSILSDVEPKPFVNGSGRLELAEAIANSRNPLTARVMVNRIWLHHFGQGLVRTPSNFGRMGDSPSHPELLDYLARSFIENGWSIKSMHRTIMLSATYQLSTGYSSGDFEIDPENRLLWRQNPRRLDAETLRDSLLYVAGNLDESGGGAPKKLDESGNRRRTVYGFVSRRELDTQLALFDFPNPNSSSPKRILTNTPLQGLFFLNSEFVMQQASALARRLDKEAGQDDPARIHLAYQLLFGRTPTAEEVLLGEQFLQEEAEAWTRYTQVLLSSNEFLYAH